MTSSAGTSCGSKIEMRSELELGQQERDLKVQGELLALSRKLSDRPSTRPIATYRPTIHWTVSTPCRIQRSASLSSTSCGGVESPGGNQVFTLVSVCWLRGNVR